MSVNSNGYLHLGGNIRNIYILLLLSLLTPGWGQSIEIPHKMMIQDATLNIPIFIYNVSNLESIQIQIEYDESIIVAEEIIENPVGILDGFTFTTNLTEPGIIQLAIVNNSANVFSGSGMIAQIVFQSIGNLGEVSSLTFLDAQINSVTVLGTAVDGSIEIGCGDVNLEATLSFGEVDLASQTIEIHLENSDPVSGFQFEVDSTITITDVSGGTAEDMGFMVDFSENNNVVLGFSIDGNEIPTGNDVLTILGFDGYSEATVCLSQASIVSGYENPQYFDVSYGDCITLDYMKGDVNLDEALDILDLVTIINIIFENISPDEYQIWASDYNSDGDINIMDIVQIVNCILTDCWEPEPSLCDGLTEVELWGEYYDIGSTTSIDLYNQGLTGSIPPEIGCLTNLTDLHLNVNQLTGVIPIEIGNLTNLNGLYLHSNQLTGEIPPEIGNLTNLTYLYLISNQLTGEIPPEIGNLTNLTYLYLNNNQLTGEIPSEIGQLTNLESLYLFYNQLTGDIPPEVCDLIENNNLIIDYILEGNNLINTCEETTDCIDIDGNVYETVQIGEQLWMAENLKVTHYNNGDEIQYVQSESSEPDVWENLSTGAYGYYNDDLTHQETYGHLYNWFAVDDSRGVCPDGWHVPSDEEFMELEMFLGMSEEEANSSGWRGTTEGSKLAGNTDLWSNGNLENNSEFGSSGFSAFPAGYRDANNGPYIYMGTNGYFWSSSETSSFYAWTRELRYLNSNVDRFSYGKQGGFSVRCLGD